MYFPRGLDGREGGILQVGILQVGVVWGHPGEQSSGSAFACRAISTWCSAHCADRCCFVTHFQDFAVLSQSSWAEPRSCPTVDLSGDECQLQSCHHSAAFCALLLTSCVELRVCALLPPMSCFRIVSASSTHVFITGHLGLVLKTKQLSG